MFDLRCYSLKNDEGGQVSESLVEHVRSGFGTVYLFGRKPVVLSLSGGVDSMVLLDIFCKLKIDFHCLHIDYGNRSESHGESKYLQSYCSAMSIPLTCYEMPIKRNDTDLNRQEYESKAKEQRFIEYGKICQKIGTDIVCLGHHDDDVIENILCNVLQNQSLSDLGKIHLQSAPDDSSGLKCVRLFIGIMKSDIYRYAEENGIFYFKDSTPKWSKRGKIRDTVLPQLEDLFSNSKDQLLRFNRVNSSNSRLLSRLLGSYTDFNSTVQDDGTMILQIPGNLYHDCPDFVKEVGFWQLIFAEARKKFDGESISLKSIDNFMQNMWRRKTILSKKLQIQNDDGIFSIVYSP